MTRIIRALLSAAAFAALSFNIAHAQAGPVTVQFNDPNCASWALSGSAPTFTLTCQALSCSIASVPANPQPTDTPTLTATCSGAIGAVTYTWANAGGPAGCPLVTASTTSTNGPLSTGGAAVAGCGYKVTAKDAQNAGGVANISLTWSSGPPPAPSGCSVAFTVGSASLPTTGGSITMVGSCTGNVSGSTTYAWTKNGASFVSGASASDTLAAGGSAGSTTTYAFQATNPGSTTTSTQQLVTVAGTGGGGGSMDLTGCTAQGYVGRGLDVTFPVSSNTSVPNGAQNATPGGTFGNSDALVVRFTTPAAGVNDQSVFQPAGNVPFQNTTRVYTVSTQPCQIATSGTPTGSIVYATVSQSPAITINNAVCPYNPAVCPVYGAWLTPNTTYYVTMVNKTGFVGAGSCAGSSCDMRIDFNK
jgi:hypothetical protein